MARTDQPDVAEISDGLTRCRAGSQRLWISDRTRQVLRADDFTPDELRRIAGEIEADQHNAIAKLFTPAHKRE